MIIKDIEYICSYYAIPAKYRSYSNWSDISQYIINNYTILRIYKKINKVRAHNYILGGNTNIISVIKSIQNET